MRSWLLGCQEFQVPTCPWYLTKCSSSFSSLSSTRKVLGLHHPTHIVVTLPGYPELTWHLESSPEAALETIWWPSLHKHLLILVCQGSGKSEEPFSVIAQHLINVFSGGKYDEGRSSVFSTLLPCKVLKQYVTRDFLKSNKELSLKGNIYRLITSLKRRCYRPCSPTWSNIFIFQIMNLRSQEKSPAQGFWNTNSLKPEKKKKSFEFHNLRMEIGSKDTLEMLPGSLIAIHT